MTSETPDPNLCPVCGERLALIQERAFCPACAMQDALRTDGSSVGGSSVDSQSLDLTHSMEISLGGSPQRTQAEFRELPSGETFGDYQIVRRLGRGGMGIVYEADHLPTSRRVALKVMTHSWDDPTARARFLREGRLAASINHPNSVYVYGTEEIDGRPTISMELVRGRTLGDVVKSDGPLLSQQAVDAVLQIIDGLDAANQAGVLHRDVKPNNCFVDENGQVKIGDFGLSITTTGRLESDSQQPSMTDVTQEGTFLGTPSYASPEQLRGEPLDHRSDIYAVGVTLYYLISGRVPFAADNMVQLLARVLDNAAPSLRSIAPDLPPELDSIVERCLRKAPGARFVSYAELRQALLPLSSKAPVAGSLGSRFLAGAVDMALISFALLPLSAFSMFATGQPIIAGDPFPSVSTLLLSTVAIALQWLYYALSEWRFGKTIGKHLLGLQVISDHSKPKLSIALVRSAFFLLVPLIPMLIANSQGYWQTVKVSQSFWQALTMALVGWSRFFVGAAMFITARSRNGNATLYDLLTGIRVVVKPVGTLVRTATEATSESFDSRETEMIGPYHVLDFIGETDSGELLLGYDTRLLRRVWIHRLASDAPETHPTVKEVSRKTQLRWLGGSSRSADEPSGDILQGWDCYEALTGGPLRDLQATSIDWQDAKQVLSELATQLNAVDDTEDPDNQVTLENCWVTDAGQAKLLPFAVQYSSTKFVTGDETPNVTAPMVNAVGSESRDPSMLLLRQVCDVLKNRFDLVGGDNQRMSLSEKADLERLQATDSVANAVAIANELACRGSVRVPARVAGMIVASLILPLFCILSLLATTVLYDRQETSMPRVSQLADAMSLRAHSASIGGLKQMEKRNIFEKHIRAQFEDVYLDQHQMSSLYGQTQLMRYRPTLDRIFETPLPSDEEAKDAARIFKLIASESTARPRMKNAFFSGYSAVFWGSLTWLEFIWLPSLFTGLLFRGGVLPRLFGLTFVNRRGQRASGLRVFFRMLVSGLFPAAIIILYGSVQANSLPPESKQQIAAACLVLIACLAVVAYRSRSRLFSDRCAGTFIVAK